MAEIAPWLKAMENGALGEARARAFLMERFWVLERSVDVNGADYLIQRKLTAKNFLDREPPRLGVVQVKFVQDGDSSISIHKEYVCDAQGRSYTEFFLLVFTGGEDQEKSYLLSASEILHEFGQHEEGNRTLLRVKASKLLMNTNYEILQKRRALDRIEHALTNADFMSNRRFLSGARYVKISPDHIDQDLLAPLDNEYGDIQKIFFDEKRKLQSTLFDIQEVVDGMQEMLTTTDPEEAFRLYEEVIEQHVGAGLGRYNITFSCDFFRDEDFFETVRKHKARLAKIRELGIEGSYFKLLALFEETLVGRLSDPRFNPNVIRVTVSYDGETLSNGRIDIVDKPAARARIVAKSREGKQVLDYDLRESLPSGFFDRGIDAKNRRGILQKNLWKFRRPFQAALDTLLLGKDLVVFSDH